MVMVVKVEVVVGVGVDATFSVCATALYRSCCPKYHFPVVFYA